MAEYIERAVALHEIERREALMVGDKRIFIGSMTPFIQGLPAADVAPVVHGRWIEQEDPLLDVYYTCSVCKEDFYIETTGYTEKDMFLYTYCPNCGARMDGGNDG